MDTNHIVVAKVDELKDGETKECEIGEAKILLIKDKGQFSAMGGKCPHLGAPLKNGVYYNGRIRCPWHGSCYDVLTGDIEDYPTFGCVPTFPVIIEGSNVVLRATPDQLKVTTTTRTPAKRNPDDNRLFVVVGGGCAGGTAAETLRTQGYTGRLVLIERHKTLPYDRTKLSKTMDAQLNNILLRPLEFYHDADIELLLGVEVTELDSDAKTMKLSDGQTLKYTKALLATGADSQKLSFIPGSNGTNVYTLRTVDEAHKINDVVEGKSVVIIGSSFIGMEVACWVIKKCASLIVVGMESVPFERVLGTEIGKIMMQFHETQKVKFIMSNTAKEFQLTPDGAVHTIVLKDDTKLSVDVVILGAGVVPATSYLKDSKSIKRERDHSIIVDKNLFSGADGLYVAGDICRFPLGLLNDELVRIEHWGLGQTQGAIAAKNMVQDVPSHPLTSIPVFWTAQYGKSFRYVGHALKFDRVIVDTAGEKLDPSNPKFAAYYIQDDKVLAACTIQRDPIVAQIAELMNANISITGTELEATIASTGSTNALFVNKLKAISKSML